ncbi:element excision factor XisH family protein [Phormidesmis sp. 146-12]
MIYQSTLEDIEPDRILYLAIRSLTYREVFEETIGASLLRKQLLKLLIFDPTTKTIVQWIP